MNTPYDQQIAATQGRLQAIVDSEFFDPIDYNDASAELDRLEIERAAYLYDCLSGAESHA